jgi:hypothetical protein
MKEETRIQKLKEIERGNHYGSGVKIPYRGENKLFNTYQIPWEYLTYNKYNGRIRSLVKTFEKHNHELDPDSPEDIEKIENFLMDSNKVRNKSTLENIVEFGQRVHGIVTAGGKIIDGNRRAMLLKSIYTDRRTKWKNHNVDDCKYFIAAILPDNIADKEIRQLETIYQMGEDAKLDYNPIEKYLMIKELVEIEEFSIDDVAKWMGQNPGKVQEWKETMVLMDEYLDELGYQEIYTLLDKREDLFLSLNKYIKRYENGRSQYVDWGYEPEDSEDLKLISFDYIRHQTDGKAFRDIAHANEGKNFFSQEKIWKEFSNKHFDAVDPISKDEEGVEEWRNNNSDVEDISEILKQRDNEWSEKVKENLDANFRKSKSKLIDIEDQNKPAILIERAKDSLMSINDKTEHLYDKHLDELLGIIIKRVNELRKIIKSGL